MLRVTLAGWDPDTNLRWHRQLIARKWTFAPTRAGRPGIMAELSSLIVRMATEDPACGYTSIPARCCWPSTVSAYRRSGSAGVVNIKPLLGCVQGGASKGGQSLGLVA